MKKKNIPGFNPTPNETKLEPIDPTKISDGVALDKETIDIVYDEKTKTFDKVHIKYSLSGNMEIVKIEKGHTNPLVMQQEMSKYFLEKLVTKRKK